MEIKPFSYTITLNRTELVELRDALGIVKWKSPKLTIIEKQLEYALSITR